MNARSCHHCHSGEPLALSSTEEISKPSPSEPNRTSRRCRVRQNLFLQSLLIISAMLITLAQPHCFGEEPKLFPAYLVVTLVEKVCSDYGGDDIDMRIEEVLYGPETLTNQTFHAKSLTQAQNLALSLNPTPKVDERGIWTVRLDTNGTPVFEHILPSSPLGDLPCRKNLEKDRYQEILLLAGMIKAASNLDAPKRRAMIEALTTNDVALVRQWAAYAKNQIQRQDDNDRHRPATPARSPADGSHRQ